MKSKVALFIVVSSLMIGCGGGGTNDTNTQNPRPNQNSNENGKSNENSTKIQTGVGKYVDSPINGVHYQCGTKSGTTGDSGSDGSFTFEVGESCLFTINGAGLTSVAASGLTDGVVVKPDLIAARYLQSLDFDGNASNGIDIRQDVVKALADHNIVIDREKDSEVEKMVEDLKGYVNDYAGKYVSMEDARAHLYGSKVNITTDKDSYRVGDRVTLTANVTGNSQNLSFSWKEGETELGTSDELIVDNFSQGTHTIKLTVKNSEDIVISESSITINIKTAYSFTVGISVSNQNPTSDQNVTLTANVSGNEGFALTYLWKDGSDEIGTTESITKQFTAGTHNISVEASANNYTNRANYTLTVSEPIDNNESNSSN